jgi:hypothetical protein
MMACSPEFSESLLLPLSKPSRLSISSWFRTRAVESPAPSLAAAHSAAIFSSSV